MTIPVTFLVSPRFTWIQLEVAASGGDGWRLIEETNRKCDDVQLPCGDVGGTCSGRHPARGSVEPSYVGSKGVDRRGGGELVVGDVPVLHAEAVQAD